MHRAIAIAIIALGILTEVACATTQDQYLICDDVNTNVTCPDNTANAVVSM